MGYEISRIGEEMHDERHKMVLQMQTHDRDSHDSYERVLTIDDHRDQDAGC